MTDRPTRIPYEEVAAFVREWPKLAGYGPAIAERFGVPVATARRWVNQARLRGYLPPGAEHTCPTCGGTGKRAWGARP